jgi:hypothetical protein
MANTTSCARGIDARITIGVKANVTERPPGFVGNVKFCKEAVARLRGISHPDRLTPNFSQVGPGAGGLAENHNDHAVRASETRGSNVDFNDFATIAGRT